MFEDLAETDVALAALRAAEVAAARAAVAQWDAALAVWESTPDDFRVGRRPQAQAEIAAALGLSELAVDLRLRLAEALRSWPLLRGLLLDGRLGVPHALAAVEEVAALGDEALAGRVLVAVLAARAGWAGTGHPGAAAQRVAGRGGAAGPGGARPGAGRSGRRRSRGCGCGRAATGWRI